MLIVLVMFVSKELTVNDETCITIDAADGSFGEVWIAQDGQIHQVEAPADSAAAKLMRRLQLALDSRSCTR